ncbi:MAG: serine/threonine-protein kinase [Solirubrobacteraceae bacterium]
MRTRETLAHPAAVRATSVRDEERAPEGSGPGDLVLGRYRLERLVGTGGFGAVWRATDERLRRVVAVKVIPWSASASPRARREALAAARLNHPGIVALHEAGEDENALYLVSELVEGKTLAELEAAGTLSDRDVAQLGIALCDALEHAHGNGVIHRDVKPQNVMVPRRRKGGPRPGEGHLDGATRQRGGVAAVKLTDFGVAHLAGDEPLTRTGDVMGTLAYMAPEQAAGRRAGAPADLYALGLLLYEAFSGVNPVRGTTPAATARRVGRPLAPIRRLRRDLPAELCSAIDLALAPRPTERGTLTALRAGLEVALPQLDDEMGGLAGASRGRIAAPLSIPGLDRILAALAAGALVFAAVAFGASDAAPLPPLAAAGAVTLLVALAPRGGWLACAALLVAWVAASRPGDALLLAAALAAPPLLLPKAARWWSAPALAPLLALAGLAPAFCALAGLGQTALRRAALGAAGFWWLSLAEPLLGRDLHLGRATGTAAPAVLEGSTRAGVEDALAPLLTSGALAGAILWAAAAVLAPLLTRRGGLLAASAGAGLWVGGLVLATAALGEALTGAVALPEPRGALAGAIVGGALAVLAHALTEPRPKGPAAVGTA